MSEPGAETRVPWTVVVKQLGERSWQAIFSVGVQHFTLAEAEDDEGEVPEAREHCEWIAASFRRAMERLGAPPEMNAPERAAARAEREACLAELEALRAICTDGTREDNARIDALNAGIKAIRERPA